MSHERIRAPDRRTRGPRTALAGIVIVVLCFALARWRSSPPPVIPADAPPTLFSGARALTFLERIEGDGSPHPVGSAQAARVRAFLVSELEHDGFAVDVQERLTAGANGMIAIVRNVVATLPGREDGPRVLVCAHYDSVWAGPGSSDDGAGTASILELARALHASPVLRNGIVLLLDEGEEAGLIGAQAFVDAHPLAHAIGAVVNLEARGTCGRAHMFETSEDNAWLIGEYARSMPHPDAVSVAYELYRRMPNDTDLTVFKRAGLQGLNFAFIGGLSRYHTPLDDVAHLDPRSLQHMGESALAMTRALGETDLAAHGRSAAASSPGNAVYTDVLGWIFVRWPESWCTPVAVVVLLAILVRTRGARARSLVLGVLAAITALVVCALVAQGIALALPALRGVVAPWSAHPWPARCAVLLGSFASGSFAARFVLLRGRKGAEPTSEATSQARSEARSEPASKTASDPAPVAVIDPALNAAFDGKPAEVSDGTFEARSGAHIVVAVLALACAILVPTASYLFLLPALAAALAVAWPSRPPRSAAVALLLPLAVAALLVASLCVGLEEAFELRMGVALGAPLGLVAMLLAPAWIRGGARAITLVGIGAAAAFVIALVVPAHDETAPSHLNLARLTDARAGRARWFASAYDAPMPAQLAQAAAFQPAAQPPIPWWPRLRPGFEAPAPLSNAPAPRLDVVRERSAGATRTVVARLRSPRGALRFAVHVPERGRLRAVIWNGQRVERNVARAVTLFTGIGTDASGSQGADLESQVELELEVDGPAPLDVDLIDVMPLARDTARALLDARPNDRVPYGEGDVDVVLERVRL